MRLVLQRVVRASVSVDDEVLGSIGPGLVALVGIAEGDDATHIDAMAAKTVGLRLFADADGRFNHSLSDVGGVVLVISQFTLLADVRKGRRPSFTRAAPPERAEALVERYAQALEAAGVAVTRGRFGAHMVVDLTNDGPVTLVIDSADLERPRRR